MEYLYWGVIFFIFALSVFDLYVGVSNDAVNFMGSAIGAKVSRFKTIMIIAAIGILVGATTSDGMMDIARHGIFRPEFFTFEELMCIFLAVVASDVVLLDVFNTLGLPTSTTVSLVFELLGGATAIAMMKMIENPEYTYAGLINTEKAFQVILAIFMSVAIAFIFGIIVQWIARVVFTFHYTKHLKYTIGIFGGISITAISYFLIVKGFGKASFMTPEIKAWIAQNTQLILVGFFVGFSVLMQILHWCNVNVFKVIVLFGTFSLAMAFAGNDLVNFIGIALAALSSFQEFLAHPGANPATLTMGVLNEPAGTPVYYLIISGIIMMIALFTSKKAHNVVKTSVDLARQSAGDEMFGSSRFARHLVRSVLNTNEYIGSHMPNGMKRWLNSRFNQDEAILPNGAAFDMVRASVNLVLAGLLIVVGTSLKLPLSTTYVAFMVAMGTSLVDRAWGRESAVFRVTGVISVIGGWFMTAGAAFTLCFIVTLMVHFGGTIAMVLLICLVVFIIYCSNKSYKKKMASTKKDEIFSELVQTNDKEQSWVLLNKHISAYQSKMVNYISDAYQNTIDGLFEEDVKALRRVMNTLDEERKNWKVIRRKELVGLRKIDQLQAVEKDTWFHLACNSCEQSLYCLKRMCEPTLEHVDNNFNPMPEEYVREFTPIREGVKELVRLIAEMIETGNYDNALNVRQYGDDMKTRLSELRKVQQTRIRSGNIEDLKVQYLYMSTLQETQEIIGHMRHWVRACRRFQQEKGVATVL